MSLVDVKIDTWISLGALVVSGVAFLVSWVSAKKSHALGLVDQKITLFSTQKEFFSGMEKWADETVMLLSEAHHLCNLNPPMVDGETFYNRRHRLLHQISAMIDRGRWYFPNVHSDHYGGHKEVAFRGYRQAVLDSLVHAYWMLQSVDYKDKTKNANYGMEILQAKKKFVSEIQQILNPAERQREFENLMKRT